MRAQIQIYRNPKGVPPVWYNLDWKDAEQRGDTFYRVDHPLAAKLVARARERHLGPRHLDFNYRGYGASISVLEPFVGRSGWLSLGLLTVNSMSQEDFLIFAAQSDDGEALNADWCHRLADAVREIVAVAVDKSGDAGTLKQIEASISEAAEQVCEGTDAAMLAEIIVEAAKPHTNETTGEGWWSSPDKQQALRDAVAEWV